MNLDQRMEWLYRLDCCCCYLLNYQWWYNVALDFLSWINGTDSDLPQKLFFLPFLVQKPLPLFTFVSKIDGDGWIGVTSVWGFAAESLLEIISSITD